MKKPEIIVSDYCEGCPHFNPEANSIYADGKEAVMTVVQCIYRDQCSYAVRWAVEKYNKLLSEEFRKIRQREGKG